MTLSLRRIWLRAHLYLGLSLGLLLALLGLTGSFLVFHHTVDEWINPRLLLESAPGPHRPLAEVVAAATAATPDQQPTARLLLPPRHEGGAYIVYHTEQFGPDHDDARLTEVHVDPQTARVNGRRVWGEYFTSWVYVLHSHLHAGHNGEAAVGFAGVGLLASVATGVILWWPIVRKGGVRAAARVKRSHLNYDLHKVVGSLSAAGLTVVALSGVYLVFPHWFRGPIGAVSTFTPFPTVENPPAPEPGRPEVDADAALAVAARAFPGARWIGTSLPVKPTDAYVVTLRRPGEVRVTWGRCMAWVDRHTGRLLRTFDGDPQTAADAYADWQFPLHNGEAFGLVGRWLVFATGLTPTLLGVTGTALWWRKRRARARQRAGRPARAAVSDLATAIPSAP